MQLAPRNHAYRISTLFKCIYVCQSLLLVLCKFQPNPRPLYTAGSRFLGSQAGHENSEIGLTMRDTGGRFPSVSSHFSLALLKFSSDVVDNFTSALDHPDNGC